MEFIYLMVSAYTEDRRTYSQWMSTLFSENKTVIVTVVLLIFICVSEKEKPLCISSKICTYDGSFILQLRPERRCLLCFNVAHFISTENMVTYRCLSISKFIFLKFLSVS